MLSHLQLELYAVFKYAVNREIEPVFCSLGKLLLSLVPGPCYLPSKFFFVQVVLSTKHSLH